MLYNAATHSLTEDNGELIATFDPSIRADKAFEIADNINDWKNILDLESELQIQKSEYNSLENENENLQDEIKELKRGVRDLQKKLDSIHNICNQ